VPTTTAHTPGHGSGPPLWCLLRDGRKGARPQRGSRASYVLPPRCRGAAIKHASPGPAAPPVQPGGRWALPRAARCLYIARPAATPALARSFCGGTAAAARAMGAAYATECAFTDDLSIASSALISSISACARAAAGARWRAAWGLGGHRPLAHLNPLSPNLKTCKVPTAGNCSVPPAPAAR